jgi:glycosyltransferase involved in cell wall biosynthesis
MQSIGKPAKISILLLVKNHKHHIRGCLETLKWADEVVVLNDASSDGTIELAKQYPNVVVYDHPMEGSFTRQRNWGLQKATGDWIMQVDVDHRIPVELAAEIRSKVVDTPYNGFGVRIWGEVLGRIFGNDKNEFPSPLLSRKGKAQYDPSSEPHSHLRIDGSIGLLKGHIIHFGPYANSDDFFSKNIFYADLEGKNNAREKHKIPPRHLGMRAIYWFIIKPAFIFFKKYFPGGYRKRGMAGFHYAIMRAIGYYMVYVRTWEIYYKDIETSEIARYCKEHDIPTFLD